MDQLPFKGIVILTLSDILQDKNLFLDRNAHNYQHNMNGIHHDCSQSLLVFSTFYKQSTKHRNKLYK
jgi:hypothetical protein